LPTGLNWQPGCQQKSSDLARISRQCARIARIARSFVRLFVLASNTFACFASWRDYDYFLSRRGAGDAKQDKQNDAVRAKTNVICAFSAPLREYCMLKLAYDYFPVIRISLYTKPSIWKITKQYKRRNPARNFIPALLSL
jgi:hypothetical protein